MRRGPKPVDKILLLERAELCYITLVSLRHGRPGRLKHLKGGVWHTRYLAEMCWDEVGRPDLVAQRIKAGQMTYKAMRYKQTDFSVPPTRKAFQDALRITKRNKHWYFRRPNFPKPRLWKGLQQARSIHELRQITRRMRRISSDFAYLASFLCSHAEGLLKAKDLPSYPKSDRPGSDDKRLVFFAKILAGLELRIAPATALKRLARMPFLPSDPVRYLPPYTEIFERKGAEMTGRIVTGTVPVRKGFRGLMAVANGVISFPTKYERKK